MCAIALATHYPQVARLVERHCVIAAWSVRGCHICRALAPRHSAVDARPHVVRIEGHVVGPLSHHYDARRADGHARQLTHRECVIVEPRPIHTAIAAHPHIARANIARIGEPVADLCVGEPTSHIYQRRAQLAIVRSSGRQCIARRPRRSIRRLRPRSCGWAVRPHVVQYRICSTVHEFKTAHQVHGATVRVHSTSRKRAWLERQRSGSRVAGVEPADAAIARLVIVSRISEARHHVQVVARTIRAQCTAGVHRVQSRATGRRGGDVGELVGAGYESPRRHAVVQPHVVVVLMADTTTAVEDEGVAGRLGGGGGGGRVVGEGGGVEDDLSFGALIPRRGGCQLGEAERLARYEAGRRTEEDEEAEDDGTWNVEQRRQRVGRSRHGGNSEV